MARTQSRDQEAEDTLTSPSSPLSKPGSSFSEPNSPDQDSNTTTSAKNSSKRSSPEAQDQKPAKKIKSERKPLVASPPETSQWRTSDDALDSEEDIHSTIKSFGQDTFMSKGKADKSKGKLDFYLGYPHNRNATLCEDHFLDLSEKWYERRKPGVQSDLEKMFKPSFNYRDSPDFSQLGLPIDEDTWDLKTLDEFKGDLSRQIEQAKLRLDQEHNRISFTTAHTPICEVGPKDEHLRCDLCPEDGEKPVPVEHMSVVPEECDAEIAKWVEERREQWEQDVLTCGHTSPIMILGGGRNPDILECEECGHTQPAKSDACPSKYELRIATIRIPVEVSPSPSHMAMNSRLGHGDVGGIHFVVDICTGKTLIKFRSTRFSYAHEAEGRGVGRDHCIAAELCDGLRAYEPTGCSDYFANCSCN
ncbi:hypothetical protein LCI18_015181 [Fusarium solani-melongenae]|uniref:Uncharacterized protein n=1 Tax=Fusarium solani subsp. cucurbitae TaxID=2747967 RepID=A0ACD3ZST6_FUSSC|nr:hypothetical protein LCI18_015181 [Fusarium solani-melongenae]